ncbi:MAG TPA: hypothetical protein VGD62_03255 [Acidobacteriaceae bacterium]
MDEQIKKAFDFAADLTKQLVSLSTSIVTVTLLFSKDFQQHSRYAKSAWVCYLLSTLCGIWTLMALTGTLAPGKAAAPTLQIGANIRLPSGAQIAFFGLATVFTLLLVLTSY